VHSVVRVVTHENTTFVVATKQRGVKRGPVEEVDLIEAFLGSREAVEELDRRIEQTGAVSGAPKWCTLVQLGVN
jgi:hypothetical protein